jgi:UDP-N-acetyl-D-mannosaminuronic acid dehydrogenase
LGQLGLPVANYLKDRGGFDTYAYDTSIKATDRAQKIAGIKRIGDNSTGIGGISNVCKPDDMFSPQIDALISIVEKISKEAKNGTLVSIESTIPKGTSKKVDMIKI